MNNTEVLYIYIYIYVCAYIYLFITIYIHVLTYRYICIGLASDHDRPLLRFVTLWNFVQKLDCSRDAGKGSKRTVAERVHG